MATKVKMTRAEAELIKSKSGEHILNPDSGLYVLKTSAKGKSIMDSTLPKVVSHADVLTQVVAALTKVGNVEDKVISETITSLNLQLPRDFPAKWGGSGKEAKEAKETKVKDGNQPARALNSFLLFQQDHKEQAKERVKKFPNVQIIEDGETKTVKNTPARALGLMWSEYKEKNPVNKYIDQAKALKEIADAKINEYKASKGIEVKAAKSSTKKKTGYIVWCSEQVGMSTTDKNATWNELKKMQPLSRNIKIKLQN